MLSIIILRISSTRSKLSFFGIFSLFHRLSTGDRSSQATSTPSTYSLDLCGTDPIHACLISYQSFVEVLDLSVHFPISFSLSCLISNLPPYPAFSPVYIGVTSLLRIPVRVCAISYPTAATIPALSRCVLGLSNPSHNRNRKIVMALLTPLFITHWLLLSRQAPIVLLGGNS
ncbi:hypothetical protein HGRIS_014664 [Hohenbuehelia grisea]|uniref:Uncharacterized protein n=1 Tax=Hohenbuehelia grisea TaxID=104357 RepID=A0ABR3JU68_9AGAR